MSTNTVMTVNRATNFGALPKIGYVVITIHWILAILFLLGIVIGFIVVRGRKPLAEADASKRMTTFTLQTLLLVCLINLLITWVMRYFILKNLTIAGAYGAYVLVQVCILFLVIIYGATVSQAAPYQTPVNSDVPPKTDNGRSVVSAEEQANIDGWIKARSLNEYGHEKGVVYAAGGPTWDSATGTRKERYEYIVASNPSKPWAERAPAAEDTLATATSASSNGSIQSSMGHERIPALYVERARAHTSPPLPAYRGGLERPGPVTMGQAV